MIHSSQDSILFSFEPLTIEKIRELWGKTYNKDGKPDWSHIIPYYHDDIIFHDSIQIVKGKVEFQSLCDRLTSRCEKLSMEINTIVEAPMTFFFDWKMVMAFRKWPSTPIYGATKLTIAEDNRIIEQRDYYDLWGDIFNGIPWFVKTYRNNMKKYFG
jgi:hypothetical protein